VLKVSSIGFSFVARGAEERRRFVEFRKRCFKFVR
jgi:hypothetical protein